MRALDPEVQDAVWAAFEPLIPDRPETHPYGGHRQRIPDRDCFDVIVIRLATGASWSDSACLAGGHVSDTTVRARRDEWIDAGIFEAVESESLAAFDTEGAVEDAFFSVVAEELGADSDLF